MSNEVVQNSNQQFLPEDQFEKVLTEVLARFWKLKLAEPVEQAELLVDIKNGVGMVVASLKNSAKVKAFLGARTAKELADPAAVMKEPQVNGAAVPQ